MDRYWHKGMLYRMLPLMKTVVMLDPNFVDAYLVGSWHLAYNATAKMLDTPWPLREWDPELQACVGEKERYYHLAIQYLKDGIRKNPRDYRLYFDLGFCVYKEKMEDYENAVLYLSEAIRHPMTVGFHANSIFAKNLTGNMPKPSLAGKSIISAFPTPPSAQKSPPDSSCATKACS